MSSTTFSKSKVVFFIIFLVLNFLLTAISAFFIRSYYRDVEIVLIAIRALSVIPVIALVKTKKGLPIALISMLVLDLILVRVIEVIRLYNQMIQFPNFFQPILFVYSILRLVLVAFIIFAVVYLNYAKPHNNSKTHNIIPLLALISATFLLLMSLSFEYSSTFHWTQTVQIMLNLLIPISLSIALMIYLSTFLVTSQSKVNRTEQSEVVTKKEVQKVDVPLNESRFTGTTFGLVWLNIWTGFVTGITFGIAFPFMLCAKEKWMASHTYINGRQLCFDGTGMQLFGNWIKWSFFVLITFGIYGFFIPIAVKKWTVSHLKISD